MKRSTLYFIVDSGGFVGFVLLTATGVLMRYVLPPGSGHSMTIWTLDRHQWGSLHFWLAIAFFAVLALHLFLHWRWIAAVLRGRPRQGSGARVALGIVGLLALLALAVAPLVSPVERTAGGLGPPGAHPFEPGHSESIRGSMTLAEVEEATGVPAEHLIQQLGLPPGIGRDQRLGRLGRSYGFAMGDLRRIVRDYQESRQR